VKRLARVTIALLLAGVAALLGGDATRPAHADATTLDAGLAVVDLTPDRPVPLAGYAARFGQVSDGVHDPVKARALVLDDGATKVAIVSVDLLGVTREAKAAVVERVARRGFTSATVFLTATHTHAGPGGLASIPLFRPMTGLFDRARFDEVTEKIALAIERADDARAPATLRFGATRAPGLQRNREAEGGPVDDRLRVLRVDGLDGRPRGLVVHFAAHPTILPAGNRKISAEWPGAMCDALEARYPDAIAMLLQGALGDVAPAGVDGDGFDAMTTYGRRVAEHSIDAVEGARALPDARLSAHAATPALPPTIAGPLLGRSTGSALAPGERGDRPLPVVAREHPRAEAGLPPPAPPSVEFGALKVTASGPVSALILLGAPGEPTGACAAEVEAPFERLDGGDGEPAVLTVACANDHLGYFTDRAAFRRGGYEASLNVVGPDAAAWLRGAFQRTGVLPFPVRSGSTPPFGPARETIVVTGDSPHALGLAHGRALAWQIWDLLRAAEGRFAVEAEKSGLLRQLLMPALATGLAPKDLVVPALVLAARRLQRHVPDAYLDEMEGVAVGAGVPYDAILLENLFLTLAEQPEPTALLQLPVRCTNAFFAGPATTLGQAVLVSTLDWGMEDVLGPRTVTLIVDPPTGHAFASVTWPGMVGVLRAMGTQGLAVSEESVACPDDARADGVPINLLLRDVVQHATGLDDAVRRVVGAPGTCGYHVTLVDGHRRDARVVERSATRVQVRRPVDGVLFGCDPTEGACFDGTCDPRLPRADGSSTKRYAACRPAFRALVGRVDVRRALDAFAGADGVFNDGTLLACAFEPQTGRFLTATRARVDPDPATGSVAFAAHDLLALLGRARTTAWAPRAADVDGAGVVEGTPFALGPIERVPLSFPSPLPSGVARNDAVTAALFRPKGRDAVGVVIHLPAWRERDLAAESLVAAGLASQGLAVVLMPLPWQASRTADGVPAGEWTLSADLARTREAWRQGLADVLRLSRWLETAKGFGPDRQAVFGISLGGHVASIALGAYPERFRAGAFVLAGGGLDRALDAQEVHLQAAAQDLAARGVTRPDVVGMVDVLDPANWANAARRDDVFLVGARADEIVPAAQVEVLAAAWGGAHVLWLEGSHMGALKEAPRILEEVTRHLKARFATR